jgi:hypothetical protein
MPVPARQCACTAHTTPTRNGHDARHVLLGRRRRGGEAAGKPAGAPIWKGAYPMVRRARTTTSHPSISIGAVASHSVFARDSGSLWLPTPAATASWSRLRRPVGAVDEQPRSPVDLVIRDRTRRVMETTTWCTYATTACRKQHSSAGLLELTS